MLRNQLFPLLIGVLIGLCLSFVCFYPTQLGNVLSTNARTRSDSEVTSTLSKHLYNETLADKLFNEVRILCWIMTTPANHKTKAIHVKNTWGQRCNKLLFMSSSADLELGSIALPVKEGRNTLWDKTKIAFQYVYKHHIDDADWFLKADDDNYMMLENIRYMLYQYRPQTAFYFGHRFSVEKLPEGYMAGGGYILSKKALEKFVTRIMPNKTMCKEQEDGSEDWEMGRCLQHSAIFTDERDEKMQKRFFPAGILEHVKAVKVPSYWYDNSQYYEVAQGSLECCSDMPASFHYINPHEMYLLEYLTRHVHPFGLEKNLNESLPRKLRLKEILRASDTESPSVNFRKHRIYHNFDESEKYKRK